MDRTHPNGRVVGIDIIPAQPPRGVSTLQGNFLSSAVQDEFKKLLCATRPALESDVTPPMSQAKAQEELDVLSTSYTNAAEREYCASGVSRTSDGSSAGEDSSRDSPHTRVVDIVLSDMSEPWAQTDGFWKRSLSDPYFRMMNTSGMRFRDHAGSMV